ncbi:MAG: hypothetical protein Q8M29_11165 [Bacteroidota bacterium]|nr:hypothetical protein [Bacteroidota bacterium]
MQKDTNTLSKKRETIIKSIALLIIGVFLLAKSINHIEPYATGDGPEYVLTTEAIYNHFTPDLRDTDSKSFKTDYKKAQNWEKNYKYETFDDLERFFANKELKFLDHSGGIYADRSGKKYGYHFFFYSALNVPARWIAHLVDANPLRCFQVTNAVFIIITLFFLLFYTRFSLWKSVLTALIFTFSTAYWHLGWTHPEVYTICLVTLGFWFYFQERFYVAILLIAIASLQNQPLFVMLAFMCLRVVYLNGFKIKNILKIALYGSPFIIPPLFYLIHFGTTNLIKDAGFLSTDFITFTRIFGFYFDINQGVILAIPFLLFAYIFFVLRKFILIPFKKENFEYNYLLPLFIIAMTFIVCTMVNWNHGQAIVNRYATWFSAIIIVHLLFIAEKTESVRSLVIFNYFFLTQAFTILYHEQFNVNDWSQDEHRPIAKWLLETHPELYNPDPQIFIVRTTRNYNTGPDVSPVFYIKDFSIVTKIAVYKDKVDGLLQYGFSKDELERIKPKLKFVNGWAYLNKGEFKTSMTGGEIYVGIRNNKLKIIETRIRTSSAWMKQIEEKAKGWGKTVEEVIYMDAEYIMKEEEKQR